MHFSSIGDWAIGNCCLTVSAHTIVWVIGGGQERAVPDVWSFRIRLLTVSTVSPLGILMNPMILIAIVGMGLVFGMPYIMDNSTFLLSSHM